VRWGKDHGDTSARAARLIEERHRKTSASSRFFEITVMLLILNPVSKYYLV
jgi:hypothetical protein